jgi:hypothetical protein
VALRWSFNNPLLTHGGKVGRPLSRPELNHYV